MSHIDTINHSHIGKLAGIEIYHPLENDKEFGLTPKSIVIGGGSGEHAMFIIDDINDCVKNYISYYSDADEDYFPLKPNRSFWSIEDSYHFYKSIKKDLKASEIFNTETYINLAIGEFLVFSGSHLVDADLIKKALSVKDKPELYAITQHPVGFPTYGKIIINGSAKFGYSFEDEKADYLKSIS